MVTNESFWRKTLRVVLVNFLVLIGLYALIEIGLHIVSYGRNPLVPATGFRIRHPIFDHTLKPMFSGTDHWLSAVHPLFTNSLGFKDAGTREVPLVADRRRIVFIGDSFVEGLGLPFDETFVGRFAAAFPEIDVLNAGVSSYSPSVYYEKLKYYLDSGLHFDEAIVYIDISDIQDEAFSYVYDSRGVLHSTPLGDVVVRPGDEKCTLEAVNGKLWWERVFYLADFVNQVMVTRRYLSLVERASLQDLQASKLVYAKDLDRSAWTYDATVGCYGTLGVEGGVDKAKHQMDRLYEELSKRGIPLSVGVYPWAQQLLYDAEESRQVKIWRDWCSGKCRRFFNHFPAFFRYKERNPEFIRSLFTWGDFHYNGAGDKLLADDLIVRYGEP
jgi:hypothetical protein